MLFGVRDFLSGEAVDDVWVFTQTKNTNELEARNKGRFVAPDWPGPANGAGQGIGSLYFRGVKPAPNESGWRMEVTGTAWSDNTKPEEPVQVVGPCITGKHDTRPGEADPVCEEPPAEVPQVINSLT